MLDEDELVSDESELSLELELVEELPVLEVLDEESLLLESDELELEESELSLELVVEEDSELELPGKPLSEPQAPTVR